MTEAVDLFAGPGGWATGLRAAGITDLGFELAMDACRTRVAAGHLTVCTDVTTLDPRRFRHIEGFVASPPCQTFSQGGRSTGIRLIDILLEAQEKAWLGMNPVDMDISDDVRDWAVLIPAFWIPQQEPEFVLLEQVPSVLPIWEALAEMLEGAGYSVWTGVLNCADYGLPQTRKRAFLAASREHPITMPAPTHTKESWVTMADALGWEHGLVGFPRRDDGLEAVEIDGVSYRRRDLFPTDGPAQTVTEKIRSWKRWEWEDRFMHPPADPSWPAHRPATTVQDYRVAQPGGKASKEHRSGTPGRTHGAIRIELDEAAVLQSFPRDYPFQGTKTSSFRQVGDAVPPLMAELLGRMVTGGRREVVLNTGRDWKKGGTRLDAQRISLDRPAPAVTTVPSQWIWHDVDAEHDPDSVGKIRGARTVTIDELCVFQSFPPDYPFHGNLTSRTRQVGDAVPPRMAELFGNLVR